MSSAPARIERPQDGPEAAESKIRIRFETETEHPSPDDDGACILDGNLLLLDERKTYEAMFEVWETTAFFGGKSKKLVLWFKLIDPPYTGQLIAKYYNVRELIGKPRRRGRFRVGRKSEFARDYASLFKIPERGDRLPLTAFSNCVFLLKPRTVKAGRGQKDIPAELCYSVVDAILKRIAPEAG